MRKSSGALALMNLLLALALLVLALAGARLYGRTLDIRRENTRLRSAVGYIQSQVGGGIFPGGAAAGAGGSHALHPRRGFGL